MERTFETQSSAPTGEDEGAGRRELEEPLEKKFGRAGVSRTFAGADFRGARSAGGGGAEGEGVRRAASDLRITSAWRSS